MARKKKQSRKYIPRDEFRRNDSPLAKGHPHYVFGETRDGRKYKSVGLTHNSSGHKAYSLPDNPNPQDNKQSYVQDRVHTAKKEYYAESLEDWKLSKLDRAIIRHITKKYKKRTNRHKKKK